MRTMWDCIQLSTGAPGPLQSTTCWNSLDHYLISLLFISRNRRRLNQGRQKPRLCDQVSLGPYLRGGWTFDYIIRSQKIFCKIQAMKIFEHQGQVVSKNKKGQLKRQNNILFGGRNNNSYTISFNLYFIFFLVIGFDV